MIPSFRNRLMEKEVNKCEQITTIMTVQQRNFALMNMEIYHFWRIIFYKMSCLDAIL